MSGKKYEFNCLKTDKDQRIAKSLFASCFASNNSYFEHYQHIEKQLEFNPALKPENYWIISADHQAVGATQIFTFPVRVGIATLQIGGIGGVCTLPKFRKQGFNDALLKYCLEQMHRLNLDLSLLGGIPNYYHRYGYTVVMPTYQFKVQTQTLFDFKQTETIRKFTADDLPELVRLFQLEYSGFIGTHLRSPEFWQYHFKLNPVIYVAANQENQITGYIWIDTGKQLRIKEAAAKNGAVAESLLRFVAAEAHQCFQPEITGNLHPEQPFVRLLLPKCDFSITTHYRSNGGWMGRIIHLESAFRKLVPELSLRLQKSPLADVAVNLGFRMDIGDLVLTCKSGQVVVVPNETPSHGFLEISQATLMQMIFGYHTFTDLVHQHLLQVPEAYRPVIEALFPKKLAFINEPDHF